MGLCNSRAFPDMGRIYLLRNISDCINAFLPLLNTKYEIVLGRKGVAVTLNIIFHKKDCYHLMGLQYLKDRPELNRDREKIFNEIIDGVIRISKLESSVFYKKIEERVHFLPLLEEILDCNDTIFKYNKKSNVYSMIDADYLLKNSVKSRNVFLFLSRKKMIHIFADHFSLKIKWIIQKIKLHGLCYTKGKLIQRQEKKSYCMIK